MVPTLPLYFDEPVEHGIEWFFGKFGPWAKSGPEKKHQD
jgi:hypothetical protein